MITNSESVLRFPAEKPNIIIIVTDGHGYAHNCWHHGDGLGNGPDNRNNDSYDDGFKMNGERVKSKGYCTGAWFDAAIRSIERKYEPPFFLSIHTNTPHELDIVPESYPKPYIKVGLSDTLAKIYGMITSIEENIGRLGVRLKELGLAENTLLDLQKPDGPPLDGLSLAPALSNPATPLPVRSLFVHLKRHHLPPKWKDSVVMTRQWRLVNGSELYNILADPGRKIDVAKGNPETVEELRADDENWWKSLEPAMGQTVRIGGHLETKQLKESAPRATLRVKPEPGPATFKTLIRVGPERLEHGPH